MPPAPVAYLDIETTGLSAEDSSVTLVGIVTRSRGGRRLEQFFVDDPDYEGEVLAAAIERLSEIGGVVTFNGHSFDLPFIRERARLHGLRLPWIEGWDLLGESRQWRRANDVAGNCRLQTMLAQFGIARWDQSGGLDVVDAYWRWVETGDPKARQLILDHNAEDVLLLPELAASLTGRHRAARTTGAPGTREARRSR
jgi:hypothetical protein